MAFLRVLTCVLHVLRVPCADAVQFGDTRPRKRSRSDHSTLPPVMPAEREPSSLLLNNSTTAVPLPKDPALYEPYKKGTFYCVCRSTHTSRRIFSRHQAQCDLWKKFLLMYVCECARVCRLIFFYHKATAKLIFKTFVFYGIFLIRRGRGERSIRRNCNVLVLQ